MIETQFYCAVCNAIAAKLQLTADNQFIQSGFMGHITEGVSGAQAALLEKALQQSSPLKLFAIHTLWAPFYCLECQMSYCYEHWKLEVQFDSDFAGWYDCTYGVCPNGHRRMVDD